MAFSSRLAAGAQTIFDCSSGFTNSGTCSLSATSTSFRNNPGIAVLSGSDINLIPTGLSHIAQALIYQTPVNVQAFTATFTFVMDGWTFAFVAENVNNNPGWQENQFVAGAGCEAGFYQAFSGPLPNNIFALDLSAYDSLTNGQPFTYSSAQIYQMAQSPCVPNDLQSGWYNTTKLSTLPVPFTTPVNAMNSFTGHTYSATVTYDGSTFSMSLFDVTAGGSCPGATCFSKSWNNVNIPSLVGSNTAYVGLTAGTGNANTTTPLLIKSFSYTVNSAPAHQSFSTYTAQPNSGGTPTAAPTFSPAAGSYAGTQHVTVASPTGSSYFCYVLSSSFPAFLPQTDNEGGCITGTLYSGPITVSSSQTLYAMAGTPRLSMPSSLTVGAYVIGGAPPPPSGACDINQDGAVNAADVQSSVNQVLGIATCGTADLQSNSQCTAVDVQRVVNAALGGACVVGP